MIIVATESEFNSFINNSLSIINSGQWQDIDFEQYDFDKKQSQTIQHIKDLAQRFDQVVVQNESLALGACNISYQLH